MVPQRQLVDSSGPGVGATRELRGFGFWVHEQITAYDAPRSCSYRVVGGFPPAHQNGTLTCTPSGDGTRVAWVSSYTIPARGGGKVLKVLTAPLMRSLAFRAISLAARGRWRASGSDCVN